MGKKYPIEIEVVSKPKVECVTVEHRDSDLPVAPAVMAGDGIVLERKRGGLVLVSAMPRRNAATKRPGMHSKAKRCNEAARFMRETMSGIGWKRSF